MWRLWGVDSDARIVQIVFVGTTILMIATNNRFVQVEYDHFLLEFLVPWRSSPWPGARIPVDSACASGTGAWACPSDRRHPRHGWRHLVPGPFDRFSCVLLATIGEPHDAATGDRLGHRHVAWAFFFRGWILSTLGRKYGTDAIWLQAVPFALMHLGKPELEQLSTVIGGAFFGILAWRTNSFLWGWLLHWFIVVWVIMVAAGYV